MHWYDNRFQGFVKYVEIDGTVKDRKRVNTFYGYFFYNEHLAGTTTIPSIWLIFI